MLLTVGLGVPLTSASAATVTSTQALYAGHGVGVVTTYDLSTGCSTVYLSTNMITWRDITPPLKKPPDLAKDQCTYAWTSAYFASPRDGWLLARNEGGTGTILRRTQDGGRTWIAQPGGSTGSNGGDETISFVNATLGWRQQFGMGSNGNYSLERSLNGGSTWALRSPDPHGSCVVAHDVFASANVGFASVTPAPATNATHLWRTRDGGVNWSVMSLPRPSSVSSTALGLYGAPAFAGREGVVPVDYPDGSRQAVYFFVTRDGGRHWSLDRARPRVAVAGELHINAHSAAAQPCFGGDSTPVASGHVVIIASAGPMTWWMLQPGARGQGSVSVAVLNENHVTSAKLRELPPTRNVTALAAMNSRVALVTLPLPYGYQSTYETSSGGSTWKMVTLPVPTES
ncbi:MAG: WD40/YVTN/BNR-like repeat-containing protein [Acidimicrobiales bacterium]